MIKIEDFIKKKILNLIQQKKDFVDDDLPDFSFAEEQELIQLIQLYAERQIAQRQKLKSQRSAQAKKNFAKSSRTLSFQSILSDTDKEANKK